MDPTLVALALAFAGILLAMRWLSRPHTVVRIEGGRAMLVRGSPPSGLMEELTRTAQHAPEAAGRVELTGRGPRLEIALPGLEERLGQQLRNVLARYRDRIR